MGATMLTRRVELRSPVPPDHQATPYPTHLPAPHVILLGCSKESFTETKIIIFINIIREEGLDYEVKHVAFRCLYFISKVRGYKVVARHLPHETADLEPLLHYLENQDPGVQLKWETHNGLLLWLSIVVKIPFHLQRFDTSTSKPIMEEF
ncbi:hypothetical protein DAPPUDRAFT_340488 [Daphnia pulex]|uniref:Tubulin-specific chaperone D C-terminal domain-containing protein n=1 Tax=Daphnia pulex TaxID=6669 RepID=E9I499_DAPPU|nr:hypothetical protein DAPPUDRAFT_340488 [Daphnia pulex]|eukprot:EFX61181.1 hypothetical protein DAPPUDRAFT_340488 [Daphnia pulex]